MSYTLSLILYVECKKKTQVTTPYANLSRIKIIEKLEADMLQYYVCACVYAHAVT